MPVRTRPEANTLAGRTAGAKSVAAIDRLLILDDVWSIEISVLEPGDNAAIESQRDEFTELMGDLEGALGDAIEQIRELQMVLDTATDDDVDVAVENLGQASPQFATAIEHIFAQQIAGVGVRGATISACQYIVEHEEETRVALRAKYESLMAGEPPNPGLPKAVRCALYLAAIGAAAATVIATHGAALALAGAVGSSSTSAILNWEKSGCVEWWQAITGGRFA